MDSFVDGMLLLFKYFRVGSLLETLEDLQMKWHASVS
jgi:hypothetical protein